MKRGENKEERGVQEDQESTWEPRECVANMAELYSNQKLGEEKQSPASGLER